MLRVVAYFTQDSLDYLRTIDDHPQLASLSVPPGKYKSARSAKNGRHPNQGFDVMVHPPQYGYGVTPYYLAYGPEHSNRSDRPNRTGHYSISEHPHTRASEVLAPLEYLQNIPPSRRHPLDEEALMSLTKRPPFGWR